MAGHSQFKNIMHRKGRQDRVKAQLFTRLQREVQVASKAGLPDPAFNPRLRAAIQAAKAANMPTRQHRPGDQARPGRRCRELRRGALRGLRPRWRGGDRRGADRQPQPYRELGALQLRQAWRCPGRDQQRQLPVRPGRPDQLPSRGGRCRRHAGGGDRRRCGGLCELGRRARDHLRRRTSCRRCRRSSRRASARPSRRS